MPDESTKADFSGDNRPVDPAAGREFRSDLNHARAFDDAALAPAVDQNLLLALVRGELSAEQSRAVYQFIHSFRSWNDAHAAVLAAEFRRRND